MLRSTRLIGRDAAPLGRNRPSSPYAGTGSCSCAGSRAGSCRPVDARALT